MLIRRAYTKEQFSQFVAQSPFGRYRIERRSHQPGTVAAQMTVEAGLVLAIDCSGRFGVTDGKAMHRERPHSHENPTCVFVLAVTSALYAQTNQQLTPDPSPHQTQLQGLPGAPDPGLTERDQSDQGDRQPFPSAGTRRTSRREGHRLRRAALRSARAHRCRADVSRRQSCLHQGLAGDVRLQVQRHGARTCEGTPGGEGAGEATGGRELS